MEQNVRQTQEAMEVMSRSFAERQAEERERQGLQERAEEDARAEHAQLLRNELVDADRARANIQREALAEAGRRFAERERERERAAVRESCGAVEGRNGGDAVSSARTHVCEIPPRLTQTFCCQFGRGASPISLE
eukprot:15456964-Alexandrium_andersonii.AAC.1